MRKNHLSIPIHNVHRIFTSPTPKEETSIKRIAATISCTIKNPIAIFPYIDHISPLSERSFIMIIVLLKVSAIAIYNASKGVNHKSILSQKPIIEVNAT